MKKFITQLGLIILLAFSTSAFASHIAGGVITYQCLGSDKYKVTFMFYRDCSGVAAPSPAQIEIYNSAEKLVQTLSLPVISTVPLPANAPNACTTVPTGICVEEITYSGNVTLPPIPGGYQLTFDLCCRNPGIINGPANSSAYSTWIPDVSKAACNNSAVYASAPPMFVCAGLPLSYNHKATDADGDVLTYSLCSAIEAAVPLTPYPYSSPYTSTNPLGGGLSINPTTGMITGTPSTLGKFVVGVCVTETRNGVVINTTTRDFQWNVVDCQIATVASALSALTDCKTKQVTFFNNSIGGVSYKWSFGDGQTATTTSTGPMTHNYTSLGSYNITLVSFATNGACNDTVKSLVTVVDTCRPCGMSVGITTVNGVCSPVQGCTQVKYVQACASGNYSMSYAGSSVSGSCGGGSASSGGGTPAPTTATVTVGGVTMPGPSTTTTYTALTQYTTQATCPRLANTSWSGGILTITLNLWMNQPQTGGATATVTGGTAPYVINWTTTPTQTTFTSPSSATSVNPGTYTAIVSDANGCTETKTFTVNGNSTLAFTASKTDATGCGLNNGTLSATVPTGSTGTVTYSWSPGGWTTRTVSNVPPGVYTVTVNDAAGCPIAATVTVGGVPTIAVNATITNPTCSYSTNGSATASASGGASPYTYSWNTSPTKTGATVNGLSKGFYTVTATDNNGCKGTFAFTVSPPAALTLTTAGTNPKCFGKSNGSVTVTATGGTGTKNYSWSSSPVQTTATATGLAAGTYTLTVTDGNGCTASTTTTLTNPPVIIHDVVNTSTMSCAAVFNGKAKETASGGTGTLTYLWSCTSATTASVSGLPVGSCTVTTTDANNCKVTDVVVITNPGVVTTTASSTPTCGGTNNGTALVTPTGGIEPYTYLWSPGAVTTQNLNGLAAGSTYTATVTDKGGCTATASVTIASTPAIVPSTVVSGCGNNAAIDLTVTGGTSPFTYVWSNGPTTQDLTGLSAATYTVTIWDVNNCYSTLATTVPVISCNPTVIANPVTICNGACGTVTATGSVGATPYTYTWSPATGLSATTGVSVSACPTTTTTYTITIKDNVAATGSNTVVVTVNPKPTVSALPATICNGNSTTLTGSGANTYTWTPGTGLSTTTGTTVTANPIITSTYTITGTTTATGCTNTNTVIVTVNPVPVVSVPPASICPGGNTPVTASGATTYTWSPATGLSGTTGATVTANPVATTTYTVCGTTSNCSSCTTVVVTVGSLVANAGSDVAICSGNSTNLSASGGTIFTWTPATGLSNTTVSNPTATPTVTTTYTVVVSDGTCSDDDQVIVTVNPNPVIVVPPATICNGKIAPLTASGGNTYTWAPGSGLSATTGSSVNANPTVTTTYTVTGTTTATGCTGSVTVIVTVNPNPVVSVPGATICQGNATNLTASGADTYTWTPATGLSSTTASSVNANPIITTTYTVTGTTTATGCTNTTTVIVTVIPPCGPGVTATGTTVCNGVCGTVTSTATGGVPPYNYLWNTGATTSSLTPSPCPTSTTTYTITVTDNSNPVGTATAIAIITVNPNPVVTVPAATICYGANTTLTASGATTYTWVPATGLNTTTGTSVTASPALTTTYTVTGSFATGCTGTAEVIVTVNPIPVVSVSSANICPNGSTVLNASGAITYTWSPGTGLSATTGSTVTAGPLGSTTYTVIGTSLGCSSSATATVTVGALVANAGTDKSICYGSSVGLSASGGTFFTWTPATGLDNTTIGNPTASPSVTTTYTVVVSDGSCSDDDEVIVTVDLPITLNMGGNPPKCFNGIDGVATVIPSGGTPTFTYSWTPGGGTSASTNGSTGTYNVIVTDLMGCTASASTVITNPTQVTGITSVITANCNKSDGSASATGSGGTNAFTYSWNTTPVQNTQTASNIPAGTYIVTIKDGNGCTSTASAIVPNAPGVIAGILSSTNVSCFGGNDGSATVSESGGTSPYTYNWAPSGGGTATASNLNKGLYTVTVTDNKGCTSTASVNITEPQKVVVTSADANMCPNASATLTASGSGGVTPITYTWNPGSLNGNSVTVSPTATGTYTVTGMDMKGCTGTATAIVTVYLTPIINVPNDTICQGLSTPLTASGAKTYTWSPATGLNTTTGTSVTASPSTTTTYTVTGWSAQSCSGVTTVVVTVNKAPVFTAPGGKVCPGADTTINITGNALSYSWSPAGSLSSSTGSKVTARPTIPTTYTVVGMGSNQCTSSITVVVNISPKPTAAFVTSPEDVGIFNPTVYFHDQSKGGTMNSWQWSFGDLDSTTSTIKNPVFKYPDSSAYYPIQLIVTNTDGCIDTVKGLVYIHGIFTFYIPNTFTPNGDQMNDGFMPKGTGIDETDYDLWIFDRWGNLIWHTEIWGEAWDGKANHGAEMAQIDTYVWKVHVKEKESGVKHNYIGHVNIVK